LIAIGGFRQVKEDGPDVWSSESDSEHSDHGEMWEVKDAYTADMIGPDGKKTSGPVKLTPEQVVAQKALLSISFSTASTELLSTGVNIQSSTQTPTPPSSDDDIGTMLVMRKAKRLATTGARPPRSESVDIGRAGGLVTAAVSGETDTCATRSRPSKT
jgi:hypothetical protein